MEPYYLAIGMTHEQFWEGDVWLTQVFREAHRLKTEMRNQELYMQGLYNYKGIEAVIGNFAQSFSKKRHKPQSYLKEPIRITPMTEKEKRRKQMQEIRQLRKALSGWKTTDSK